MLANMMLCEAIGQQIAELPKELSDAIEHATTRAVIDWVAALSAGADGPAPVAIRRALAGIAGQGSSAVIRSNQRVDARSAALANATAAHAAEVDDIYRDGIYHPGAPTIAAALALGQQNGISGKEFLRVVAIGYEVGCRIAAAVTPSHYRYWHTTGTVGTLGAAVAAASVLSDDPAHLAHALALAGTFAAGLQQSFRSEAMAKPLHAGHAADAGVLCAIAAVQDMTGALDVLDGPAGFGAAMTDGIDWQLILRPWQEPWAVMEMTVKNHTGCGHTFAPVDAIISLRERYDLKPDDIDHILVETAAIPIEVAGNRDPHTAFEAKFSIPYCLGAAITYGSVRLSAFSDEALVDPGIREIVERTELKVASEFDTVFPSKRAARVTVIRTGGEPVSEEAWTRRGDPDAPLSDDELSAKFVELVTPALGDATASLLETLWSLRDAHDIDNLLGGL